MNWEQKNNTPVSVTTVKGFRVLRWLDDLGCPVTANGVSENEWKHMMNAWNMSWVENEM